MKILHMTPVDVSNGVYHYIFSHMRHMDMQKFQFSFLTRGEQELKQTKEYKRYGFPVYRLHHTQRDGRQAMAGEIREILRQGFDLIHLHTSSWRGFLIEEVAMETGMKRVVVHSHSTGIDASDSALREQLAKENDAYRRQFTMDYATDVCACSHRAADWLFGPQIPRERIRILPNAVDVGRYRFDVEKRERIRRDLHLEKRTVVGNIGRYSYSKNQEFLIRAFARAHEKNRELFLLFLGEGELLEEMEALAERLGVADSMCCLGWQENVEDYLQGMDLFCLPSRFEGLPISVVEAQAAGLECLVSDRVTEEVKITGLVSFLPLEEGLWAEKIAGCGMDARRRGWDMEIADAGYDIRAAAKRLEEFYERF